MTNRAILRQFLIVFAGTAAAVLVIARTDLISFISYSMEKGRLKALSETLPSEEVIAQLHRPNRAIAELVTPAVVYIETIREYDLDEIRALSDRTVLEELRRQGLSLDDVHPWGRGGRVGEGENRTFSAPSGLGSGFIFDAEHGYVLTNHHVVADADRIDVVLADGRRTEARVLGSDAQTDLAVLLIDADRLFQVTLGDSGTVAPGDEVFALGNPFGLEGTFSRGIISAVGRSNININNITYRGFLQTDAVINPGNSGGPLVNQRGEVIGINTAIASDSGHFAGVGFAIPSSRAVQLVPRLIAGGEIVRGFLGVATLDLREARKRGEAPAWDEEYGVVVSHVVAGSAADQAGIEVNDIILEIEDHRITGSTDLMDYIALLAPGSRVTIRLWRAGRFVSVTAALDERPSQM